MIDIKAVQFLCSRLCHDLVGGSSAINAGFELLEDGGGVEREAQNLIKDSAKQISNRIAFFRVAFGSAEGKKVKMEGDEIRVLCENFVSREKIRIEWKQNFFEEEWKSVPLLYAQILLNLFLIAQSCIPRGGIIKLHSALIEGGKGLAVEIEGQDCAIKKEHVLALNEHCVLEDINPKNISTYFAQRLTRLYGGEILAETKNGNKGVTLATFLPEI